MADSFQTLAHLVTINDRNALDDGISDLLDDAPLLQVLAGIEASNGTDHKFLKETTGPTVGFRAVNDGRDNSVSVDTLITIATKILDASFSADVALADNYKSGVEAYLDREGMRHLKAAFFKLEKQLLGGTVDGDSAGFTGLADSADLNALADDQTVDAAGSAAGTGSSCWLIRTTDDAVAAVLGNGGNISVGDATVQRIAGSATGTFPGYYTPIQGYAGLQLGSKFDAVRIVNLTEDAGKGLTDDLIADALSKFKASRGANRIAMARRSITQLQQSRTATNPTGAPAPFPTEAFGVPITVSDGCSITETIIA
jgi:hypothetical protein